MKIGVQQFASWVLLLAICLPFGFSIMLRLAGGQLPNGNYYGEFWYNESMVWKIILLTDTVEASHFYPLDAGTFVQPHIDGNLFILKVY